MEVCLHSFTPAPRRLLKARVHRRFQHCLIWYSTSGSWLKLCHKLMFCSPRPTFPCGCHFAAVLVFPEYLVGWSSLHCLIANLTNTADFQTQKRLKGENNTTFAMCFYCIAACNWKLFMKLKPFGIFFCLFFSSKCSFFFSSLFPWMYRKLTGLRKEDVYCNLRVPDQFQSTKDDISIVLLAGWTSSSSPVFCFKFNWVWVSIFPCFFFWRHVSTVPDQGHGIFCVDVKPWRGTVSAHQQNWHVQLKEENQNVSNTRIEQIDDPLEAIMVTR